ncbi:hypothetical protein Pan54_46780 [Rubinisphaera italica]|uniref:Uncharacterized protein n=1 Tax=Rubinisphaera italica TaxID=2527969 RepID=A0A5C5XMW4_9PLAN|nr:hypothetical protein Pan54_46780 [Rubinisphaera italica]
MAQPQEVCGSVAEFRIQTVGQALPDETGRRVKLNFIRIAYCNMFTRQFILLRLDKLNMASQLKFIRRRI